MRVIDILHLKSIEGSFVIAGEDKLESVVTGVNVMEVPDIIHWVKNGEFLVTTGYSYKDNPSSFAEIIPQLAKKGVVAVGIKRKRYFETIPQEFIRVAEENGLVLIELHEKVIFSAVVRDVMTEIIAEEYKVLASMQDKISGLSELLVRGEGIQRFLQYFSCILNNPIVLIKQNNEMILEGIDEKKFISLSTDMEMTGQDMPQGFSTMTIDGTKWRVYSHVINHEDEMVARLLILEINKELTNEDILLIHQTAYMIDLELLSETVKTRTEMRYVDQLLQDWVLGKLESASNLRTRSDICNMRINENCVYRVLVIPVESEEISKKQIVLRLRKNLQSRKQVYFTLVNDQITCIVPETEEETVSKLLLDTVKQIIGQNHAKLCIGCVSQCSYNLWTSFDEACKIVKICEKMQIEKEIVEYDDIGVFALLYRIPADKQLENYMAGYLTPLLCYDKEHTSNLVETLRVYIENKGNKKITAEKLFTHYNTVSYRLERINEILGKNLEAQRVQFEVQLAFILYDMYM